MQAIVTEFLIKNAHTLFSNTAQNGSADVEAGKLSYVAGANIVLPYYQ